MLCKHLKFLGELIKDSVPYENVYNSKLCSLFSSLYTFSSFAWQSLETSASACTMFVFSCNPSFYLHLSFDSSSCFVCLFIHLIVFVFSLCSCIIIRRNPHRKKLSPAISLEVVCVCVCPDVPMETTKMQTPNFLVNFPKLFKSHAHIHFTLLRTPWISLFMFFILFLFLHSFENWQIFIAKTNNNNTHFVATITFNYGFALVNFSSFNVKNIFDWNSCVFCLFQVSNGPINSSSPISPSQTAPSGLVKSIPAKVPSTSTSTSTSPGKQTQPQQSTSPVCDTTQL